MGIYNILETKYRYELKLAIPGWREYYIAFSRGNFDLLILVVLIPLI